MYEKMYFKSGKCGACRCSGVVVSGRDNSGKGVCYRCDREVFEKVGEIQKERWISGGRANPYFKRKS